MNIPGRSYSILIVEDELLIAMDLADLLTTEGFDVPLPIPTVDRALEFLKTRRPDAAILDVNLRGAKVTPVALMLREMGVPYLVVSAQSRSGVAAMPALAGAPFLDKPIAQEDLLRELRAALAQEAPVESVPDSQQPA